MSKIRWGILGAAKIATVKVVPAMQRGKRCDILAIASRSIDKAREAARELGLPRAYGSYDELLADRDIDAVYIPLPNHLHVPWSIRALEAGKHVLCEKPIGLSVAEAEQLAAAGRAHPRLKLMEAFMYRHHPQWIKARELATTGAIGALRTIQCFFSYFNRDPQNVRNQAAIGGGALMDIGCYPISLARWLFAAEPTQVQAKVELDPQFGTDRIASAILEFPTGTATFTCGTQLAPYQRVQIVGTEGRIEIEIPFNAPTDRPCRLWHQTAGGTNEITFPVCDQYTIQGDLFSQAVLEDRPVPTPFADAVENMRVIEAVSDAARQR
ncbi:MAG TPA: Gfo/Idh/MocA family oxidoreductase [Pirellulales bacterium]|jgi:predicted dehydrogenase|nr:Gfo/Idh/MocA family oxidoreductase [Pirellulales bacterium]